ncbi:hypothetical protein VD0002_g5609 [Verticillium dahliae]|uniref:Uncharacterized protein n=1 Tax=Verticillium dahliae TaxID=27337 RepID=A0AA44W9G0_VERDA|nr:hypothetical protein BJF96_g10236 [Verticillium dahliae]PNH49995.1 hypothetical protein VD0003_g7156 [Verticillium dahliae]PNH62474.1 hypothetical protein VD0002_g5609 [Verticillium dahliae]
MLATTKSHAKFLGTLRTWWTQANIPNSFIELTSKLYKQYNDVLPTRDSVAGPSKRSWTDQWSGTEGAVASSSNKRRRGIEARGQAHELGPVSEDLPTSSAFETDDEEVEEDDDDVGEGDDADEEGKEDGMNFEALEEQLEGSLAGMVYQLEPMDAIQVLASSKVNVLLTMPHRRWARPFISFYCSEKTALRFLTKRNQVMELTQPAQFPQAPQVPHLPQLAQSYTTHSK